MGMGMLLGRVSGVVVIVGAVLARVLVIMHERVLFVDMLVHMFVQVLVGMHMFMLMQVGHVGMRMLVGMGMFVLMTMQVLVLMRAFHTASFLAGGIVLYNHRLAYRQERRLA